MDKKEMITEIIILLTNYKLDNDSDEAIKRIFKLITAEQRKLLIEIRTKFTETELIPTGPVIDLLEKKLQEINNG